MRFRIITILVSVVITSMLVSQQAKLKVCTITIIDDYKAEKKISVELALTARERTYGLMKRTELGENEGMLFVHPSEQYLSYWMKNVSIPLSIAFIDNSGIIRDIQDMKPLDASAVYLSSVPVRYALEMNQGWFEKNKIIVGNRVVFNGCLGQ